MNKNFYGICRSADSDVDKMVWVSDPEVAQQDFNFNKGDLLTVFFANGNSQSNPKLVIYVGDTEQEASTTSDEGKFIKTYDVRANLEEKWEAGETVIFAYTQLSNSQTYYWALVNPQEEEEEEESSTNLTWEPISSENLDTLGTLTCNEASIDITFPLETTIRSYIPNIQQVERTSQLINNGGPDDEGEPFITKYVPEDLYFNNSRGLSYVDSNDNVHPYIILNDELDRLVIGDNSENSALNNIYLKNATIVDGHFFVVNDHIVSAKRYLEDNVFLDRKYSTILEVLHYTTSAITIPVNEFEPKPHPHQESLASLVGNEYEAIGIVGYNLNYAGEDINDASYGNLWECHLIDDSGTPKIEYSIRNLRNTPIVLTAIFDILCRKIFS